MEKIAMFGCLMMVWIILGMMAYYAIPLLFLTRANGVEMMNSFLRRLNKYWQLRTATLLFGYGWSGKLIAGASAWLFGLNGPTSVACIICYASLSMLFTAIIILTIANSDFKIVTPKQQTLQTTNYDNDINIKDYARIRIEALRRTFK